MPSKWKADNTRLLLHAISDAIECGASPLALAFYGDAAEALACDCPGTYLINIYLGEKHALS